jgi:hypothetical protein
LILLPAELHIPTKRLQQLYADNLPIISPLHGLGMLGVVQCWIAAVVLGKYVGRFEQVTGWIGFIIGCLNCLAVSHLPHIVLDLPPTHNVFVSHRQGIIWRASAKEKRKIFSWENAAQL